MSHDSNNKNIIVLGAKDEVVSIDMVYLNDGELAIIMDFIHGVAYQELLSRTIQSMVDWSLRTQNLFKHNNLSQVGHIMMLTKNQVNQLNGFGYITRKEIYDVYKSYGLIMPQWEPGYYYERMNNRYKFTDEMEVIGEKNHDM